MVDGFDKVKSGSTEQTSGTQGRYGTPYGPDFYAFGWDYYYDNAIEGMSQLAIEKSVRKIFEQDNVQLWNDRELFRRYQVNSMNDELVPHYRDKITQFFCSDPLRQETYFECINLRRTRSGRKPFDKEALEYVKGTLFYRPVTNNFFYEDFCNKIYDEAVHYKTPALSDLHHSRVKSLAVKKIPKEVPLGCYGDDVEWTEVTTFEVVQLDDDVGGRQNPEDMGDEQISLPESVCNARITNGGRDLSFTSTLLLPNVSLYNVKLKQYSDFQFTMLGRSCAIIFED